MLHYVKKITLACALTLVFHTAQASIIELNTQDGEACRQALRNQQPQDRTPLILIYNKGYEPEEQLIKNYEAVALQHPERAFFKFDIESANTYTYQECLGLVSDRYIAGTIIEKVMRIESNGMTYITNPYAAISGIELTQVDIKKFVETYENKKPPVFQLHNH